MYVCVRMYVCVCKILHRDTFPIKIYIWLNKVKLVFAGEGAFI